MKLRVLDLFSGIGGFSLGLERTGGFETVAFCEIDPYCRKVLAKHWPGVPIYEDVKELNAKVLADAPQLHGNGRELHGKHAERQVSKPRNSGGAGNDNEAGSKIKPAIDVICGGFPCQPFSVAGKQQGESDDRYLWPEMHRLVDECRPDWFIGENVAGLIHMGLDRVLSDLEESGYTARTFNIPACAVDAPHRRQRLWIVAHTERAKRRTSKSPGYDENRDNAGWAEAPSRAGASGPHDRAGTVAHSNQPGPQGHGGLCERGSERIAGQGGGAVQSKWIPEPPVGRVAHGVPKRLHEGGLNGDEMGGEKASAAGGPYTQGEDMPRLRDGCGLTEAPPGLQRSGPLRNTLSGMPCEGGSSGRPQTTEADETMQDMRDAVSAVAQQKAQYVQPGMPIGDRETERQQAVAWEPESPDTPRVATGVPNRVDRLRALGNAVVPQVVELIGRAILEDVRLKG